MELSRFRPGEDSLIIAEVANHYVVEPINSLFGMQFVPDGYAIPKFEKEKCVLDLTPIINRIAAIVVANDGGGEGILKAPTFEDGKTHLHAKSLVAGANITLSSDGNTITINGSSEGGAGVLVVGTAPIVVTPTVADGVTTYTVSINMVEVEIPGCDGPFTVYGPA